MEESKIEEKLVGKHIKVLFPITANDKKVLAEGEVIGLIGFQHDESPVPNRIAGLKLKCDAELYLDDDMIIEFI